MERHGTAARDLGLLDGRVVLFGGPYGNLPATQAMRLEAVRLGVPPSRVVCTGDLAAYCAEPDAVVSEIRDWGVATVMGNCEQSLAVRAPDCGCGFEKGSSCALLSDDWYRYCDQNISKDNRRWMRALPPAVRLRLADRSFLVVHAAPSSINRFVFASTPAAEKALELDKTDADVVIGGHCGIPFGQEVGDEYWLNSGVIGMPANDGSRDGWYLLLDPRSQGIRAEWRRLGYRWQQAQRAMRRAGLRGGYADALDTGLWPGMDVLPDYERSQRGMRLELTPLIIPGRRRNRTA